VESARENGMGFNWIGADGFYGDELSFLYKLDAMGETFVTLLCHTTSISRFS